MKLVRIIWPLYVVLILCGYSFAQTTSISLCALQQNPARFLNSKVEVEALVFAGIENPHLAHGKCSFPYALGDDYQVFGERFPVEHDEDWKLLKVLLGKSNCASNVRIAKARITGTIIRVPATGTIEPYRMPLELVVQSVSSVERVPVKCSPRGGS